MSKLPIRPEADKISRVPGVYNLPRFHCPLCFKRSNRSPKGADRGLTVFELISFVNFCEVLKIPPFALVLRDFVELLADGERLIIFVRGRRAVN